MRHSRILISFLSLALALLLTSSFAGALSSNSVDPLQQYHEPVDRIIETALASESVVERLAYLCDRIGHRLSGSPQLEKAIRWAATEMKADGLENVRLQPVMVTNWKRGEESLQMLEPLQRPLSILGLGGSVGTGNQPVEAEALVVQSFDELEALTPEEVQGRIIVYNVPWEGYGRTVRYRGAGASRAAALGAVAALVRSVTPFGLQTPHTGSLRYDPEQSEIPAAAITIEDSLMLQRLADGGERIRLRLEMEARTLPDAESANVIGEIVGREYPEQVVVIGSHIDSWDVGQGAHDDGAGVVVSMEAARLIRELGLRPRRTLRVVLFTNEENGLAGGRAYRELVGDAVHNHVAAIEMDAGAEKPVGFGFGLRLDGAAEAVYEQAYRRVQAVGMLLQPIGASEIARGGGGADISPLMREGVPGLVLRTVGEHYFDWHHTWADTFDKIDPDDLRANLAAMTVMAYILADMPEPLVPGKTE